MFAVIKTGGKQYRVAEHDVIRVEKLAGEAGETVELGEVLMLGNGADARIGAPLVEGARVVATILEQAQGPKILVFKKKRRKNYRRTRGHRQDLTVLRVTEILSAGETPKTPATKAAPAPVEAKSEETAPKAKAAPEKVEPKQIEKAPVKAKAAPKMAEDAPTAKAAPKKAAPTAKAAPKADEKAPTKAKSAPKKSAATKAPAKAKSAAKPKAKSKAKPKAKTDKGGGKEKA